MVQCGLPRRSRRVARACRNSLLWYNPSIVNLALSNARACRNSLLWYNASNVVRTRAKARACRNSLLWYNTLRSFSTACIARACRNSLLWYNDRKIRPNEVLLGLVGIPCYGTMRCGERIGRRRLGLVGIPCYGTIRDLSAPCGDR